MKRKREDRDVEEKKRGRNDDSCP